MLNNCQLNKTVPIPLYSQLKELIVKEIKNENYKNKSMIPTEIELCEMFQISRTTVRQAVIELVQEGWLYRVKSKGTFVTKPIINQDFIQTLKSFNEQIIQSERTPRTEILDLKVIFPSKQVYIALKLQPNEKVIYIHRRRFADEEPIVTVKTYLSYEKCSFVMNHNFIKESLYPVLSMREETHVYKIKRLIEATQATVDDIKYLNIKRGIAIQQFISTGYNMFEEPIEYSLARYRGDRNSFEVVIAPSSPNKQ